MYIYIYLYMYTLYMYTLYMYTCIYVYMYIYMYTCIHTYIHVCTLKYEDNIHIQTNNVYTYRNDAALGGAVSLSLRQLIRITRRLAVYPDDFLPLLQRTCMTAFLPAQVCVYVYMDGWMYVCMYVCMYD